MSTTQTAIDPRTVGGSDVAAILGLDKYRGPMDVWLRVTGRVPPQEPNIAMRVGTRLEALVRELYSEQTGSKAVEWAEPVALPEPWMRCNPDADVVEGPRAGRGLELKAVSIRQASAWEEPPPYYVAQCAWYRHWTGRPAWDLAALLGNEELVVHTVEPMPEFEEFMVEEVRRFWRDHVVADRPPAPSASEASREWIRKTYPRELSEDLIQATPALEQTLETLAKIRDHIAELEGQKEALEQVVKAAIGNASGIRWSGGTVTWKWENRRQVDWQGLARKLGATEDLVAEFTKLQGLRVLRWKGGKR